MGESHESRESRESHESDSSQRGLQLAVLAYGSWGLLALFWKQLAHVPAVEQLAHRVVWAAVVLLVLLAARGRLAELRELIRDRSKRRRLALSAALLGVNWFVFVYAVANDRVLHVSLGYYINPIVSMILGMLVLGERLRRLQWAAVVAACCGVGVLLWWAGELPWIGVTVALAFGFYGLARKTVAVEPLPGTALETLFLGLPCLALILWLELGAGTGSFVRTDTHTTLLLLVAGPVTALPVLWFAGAARRLPLSAIGFLQYITPTLHFLIAVLVFGEAFTRGHQIAFLCIWLGVALFGGDHLLHQRAERRAARPAADAACGRNPPT